jgi:hypothetical protein
MTHRLAAIAVTIAAIVTVATAGLGAGADHAPPEPNARFDYQIGGDYPLPSGVTVVSRDWFSGDAPVSAYGICYVNAYQTQANERGVDRPDEKRNWPKHLVLEKLGDDPNWGGEYLIDISTASKRADAAAWVQQMIEGCAGKGFEAVEFDNLDSWTRFNGTPLARKVPFERPDAVAYAALLVEQAHALGLAVAQKNTVQLSEEEARDQAGFDFAIAEECGRYHECQGYRDLYGNHVIVIEYRKKDFKRVCENFGELLSVVQRDRNVSTPQSKKYVYKAC